MLGKLVTPLFFAALLGGAMVYQYDHQKEVLRRGDSEETQHAVEGRAGPQRWGGLRPVGAAPSLPARGESLAAVEERLRRFHHDLLRTPVEDLAAVAMTHPDATYVRNLMRLPEDDPRRMAAAERLEVSARLLGGRLGRGWMADWLAGRERGLTQGLPSVGDRKRDGDASGGSARMKIARPPER